MPLYHYECRVCAARQQIVRPVKEHTKTIPCTSCGEQMRQVLGFRYVIPDIEPYQSMVTGERIRGRSHHRQHLKEHGLFEVGNERLPPRRPKPMPSVVDDLKRAFEEVKSR